MFCTSDVCNVWVQPRSLPGLALPLGWTQKYAQILCVYSFLYTNIKVVRNKFDKNVGSRFENDFDIEMKRKIEKSSK